ncbi:MAG: hypothetical protein WD037_04100 [Balneolales bacterium]
MKQLLGYITIVSLLLSNGHEVSEGPILTGNQSDATIVLDASDFLDRLPRDHYLTNAGEMGVSRVFNNTALVMGSRSQYVKKIEIPEDGIYHLFARTHGNDNSYFRVAVDDQLNASYLGNQSLHWEHAGTFDLKQGTSALRLMQIMPDPVLDVLVLTKNENFGEQDLAAYELHPDVELLKSYDIPHSGAVKFGDLTGDGLTDFVVLTRDYSLHAFNNAGDELWSWESPEEYADARASFEAPGLVWDLDQDGSAEAIYWRYEDDKEWLVVSDGQTGDIKYQTEWPTKPLPHVYNNFRLAVGNLDGGYPDNIIAFTDMGGQMNITAYDNELQNLWQHEETRSKDHLGHYVYPLDLTGDGMDEIAIGSLLLNAHGEEIWNRFDFFYNNRDHVDSYRFADLTGDGRKELVAAHSEVGVVAYDAEAGDLVWQNMAEHTQQLEVGDFISGVESPQVIVGARTYGNRSAGESYLWSQVQWFTPQGELAGLWPERPLNGNPVFVRGNWDGHGEDELFWYKFKIGKNGKGRLHFSEPVFHMFDFVGNGVDEVITLGNGVLRVYGNRNANQAARPDRKTDPEYLRRNVANHTHY